MAILGPTPADDEDAYVSKTVAVSLLSEALVNLRTAAIESRRTSEFLKVAFKITEA